MVKIPSIDITGERVLLDPELFERGTILPLPDSEPLCACGAELAVFAARAEGTASEWIVRCLACKRRFPIVFLNPGAPA